MKPTALYLILSVCLLTAACRRQQVVKEEPKAQIEFLTDLRYDFSDEGMKDTVTHWFVYRNTGSYGQHPSGAFTEEAHCRLSL